MQQQALPDSPIAGAAFDQRRFGNNDPSLTVNRRGFRYKALLGLGLLIYLITFYLDIPFEIAGFVVPSMASLALSVPLLLASQRAIRQSDLQFLLSLAGVFTLSLLLSPGYGYLSDKVIGMVATLAAAFCAVVAVVAVRRIGRHDFSTVLFILWVMLLFGSLAEMAGLIDGVSDSFRSYAYGRTEMWKVYQAEGRDLTLVGWSRPKLFSSEPSHVAKAFFIFLNAWFALHVTAGRFYVALAATALMLVIFGSPILLASLIVSGLLMIYGSKQVTTRLVLLLVASFVGGVGLLLLANGAGGTGAFSAVDRVVGLVVEPDAAVGVSENLRVVIPYLTMFHVLAQFPLFGMGISGNEALEVIAKLPVDASVGFGNNAFATLGIYFGVVGTSLFLLACYRFLRRQATARIGVAALAVALFAQTMGGFETVRFWGFCLILAYAVVLPNKLVQPVTRPSVQAGRVKTRNLGSR